MFGRLFQYSMSCGHLQTSIYTRDIRTISSWWSSCCVPLVPDVKGPAIVVDDIPIDEEKNRPSGIWIVLVIGLCFVCLLLVIVAIVLYMKRTTIVIMEGSKVCRLVGASCPPLSEVNLEVDYETLDLDRENPLGSGSFGVVYKGTYQNKPVAVKVLAREYQVCACESRASNSSSWQLLWDQHLNPHFNYMCAQILGTVSLIENQVLSEFNGFTAYPMSIHRHRCLLWWYFILWRVNWFAFLLSRRACICRASRRKWESFAGFAMTT